MGTCVLTSIIPYADGSVHCYDKAAALDTGDDYSGHTPYFVSASASGGGVGTIGDPWTMEEGWANAVAGDVVWHRAGTYELYYDIPTYGASYYAYRGIVNPSNSGTALSTIVFATYLSEVVTLNAHADAGLWSDYARPISSGAEDYIVMDGFEVQSDGGTKAAGVAMTGADAAGRTIGCVAKNLDINGGSATITSTDNREGIRLEATTGAKIQNCTIYGFRQTTNWANTAGIKMYDNDTALLENNDVDDCSCGIYLKSNIDDCIVRDNYVHDCYSAIQAQVYLTQSSTNNSIYNNVVVNNTFIGIGNIQEELTANANGWKVYNNTVYGGTHGIIMASADHDIYNNIVDGFSGYTLWTYEDCDLVTCDHNQHGTGLNIIVERYSGTEATYATLIAWQASGELKGGGNPGAGSLASSPEFLDATTFLNTLADFALAGGSPCIGTDRAGTGDMGADITTVGVL